jgi:polysaccharide pyruvyl transferase WcaK-like protein
LARILGAKVMYLGVGVGKALRKKTHLITWLASAISSVIYVRDERSKDYFQKIGTCRKVVLGPDPVYGLSSWLLSAKGDQHLVRGYGRYLLVSYRCLDEFVDEQIAENRLKDFSAAIVRAVAQGGFDQVVLMDADSSVDAKDSRYIQSAVSKVACVIYLENLNFSEQIAHISRARAVLTGRLHVGVMAHMLSVPFALLNYAPKNKAFLHAVSCDLASLEYSDLPKIDLCRLFDNVGIRMNETPRATLLDMERQFSNVLREVFD